MADIPSRVRDQQGPALALFEPVERPNTLVVSACRHEPSVSLYIPRAAMSLPLSLVRVDFLAAAVAPLCEHDRSSRALLKDDPGPGREVRCPTAGVGKAYRSALQPALTRSNPLFLKSWPYFCVNHIGLY